MEMKMKMMILLGSCPFLRNMKTLGESGLIPSPRLDIFSLPLLDIGSAHAAGGEAQRYLSSSITKDVIGIANLYAN